ncbi:MAG: helix-turn-helix domain-containing protein [Ignavibacteriales bacterium]
MFIKKSEKYFSVEEAATLLGKSTGQITLYIWLHKIPNVEKVGECYIIPKEEVYRLQDNPGSSQNIEENRSYKDTSYYENSTYEDGSYSY